MKLYDNILVIEEFGTSVFKKYKRIVVFNKKKKIKEEISIKDLRTVIILTKLSISSELIKMLTESGISIIFCGYLGRPYAKISGVRIGGTPENRKRQYNLANSGDSGLFVKKLIDAKIFNQLENIKYYAKSKRIYNTDYVLEKINTMESYLEKLNSIENEKIDLVRQKIMNIEALSAKEYFEFISNVYGKDLEFSGRDYRSNDILNVLLNIGYNLISIWYWIFSEHFSLDPFEGYLHVERPGRLSLIYDLMEPIRPIIDRITLSFIFKNNLTNKEFQKNKYKIISEFKKYFISQLIYFKLELYNKKFPLRYIIFKQIESFVSFIYGKSEPYCPKIYW